MTRCSTCSACTTFGSLFAPVNGTIPLLPSYRYKLNGTCRSNSHRQTVEQTTNERTRLRNCEGKRNSFGPKSKEERHSLVAVLGGKLLYCHFPATKLPMVGRPLCRGHARSPWLFHRHSKSTGFMDNQPTFDYYELFTARTINRTTSSFREPHGRGARSGTADKYTERTSCSLLCSIHRDDSRSIERIRFLLWPSTGQL